MRCRLPLLAALLALGCAGDPASDAEVCRDTIQRLCGPPRCGAVDVLLAVESGCEDTLLARTGCFDDAFTFSLPSRERFLSCRAPLVRQSAAVEATPSCREVEEALSCQDLIGFFKGGG